ncbi:MAG: hypothetical protein V4608_04390 [Bacteroidota bacterium]
MKNYRKIVMLISLASLGLSSTINAQSTTYKILFDDPLAYKKLFINFNLIELDVVNPSNWRVGLGAEYTLNQKFLVHADYNFTPLGSVGFNSETINKAGQCFEAGGIFSFASKIKPGKMKIRFNSQRTRYRMKVTCNIHKQYGIRGGINYFSTPKKHDDFISYSNAPSIYAGIVVMRTKNPLVSVEDYGTYSRNSRGKFYIDVMFAPVINVSDNTNYAAYVGSASTATAATFPDLTKNHIGARLGYMKRSNFPLPLYQGFETGIRPGVGDGFFFLCKIAVSVGFIEGKSKTPAE